jgi:hypothetical protein
MVVYPVEEDIRLERFLAADDLADDLQWGLVLMAPIRAALSTYH